VNENKENEMKEMKGKGGEGGEMEKMEEEIRAKEAEECERKEGGKTTNSLFINVIHERECNGSTACSRLSTLMKGEKYG
jgi:hypothetical protein